MKTAVITGANRGIGLSLTHCYLAKGWAVYGVCRHCSSELDNSGAHVIEGIDVADPASIGSLTTHMAGVVVDLLINNAGVLQNEVLGAIDYQSVQTQFDINALGPLRITEALSRQFSRSAKVAMVTSRMGSITDNTSGGRYGYRMSKAALNIAAASLAHDLRPQGVAVAIIHPGLVGTRMIGGHGDITPDQAAERISQRIDQLNLDNSGSFWHANGELLPW